MMHCYDPVVWKYDAQAPIRHSPYIDKDGKIAIAAGSDLLLLSAEGELLSRWSGESVRMAA